MWSQTTICFLFFVSQTSYPHREGHKPLERDMTARTDADRRPRKIRDVPPHEGKVGGQEAEAEATTKANQLGRPLPKPYGDI